MSFAVEPLSPDFTFGRTIRGLTSRHIVDEAVRDQLRRHWLADGLIVFRDGEISEDFHLELSRVFGPLEAHPIRETQTAGKPELITVASTRENATVVEIDGEEGGAYIPWHTDLVYVDRINHGGILRALRPSRRGGITGFLDQIDAYDRLPDALKSRIEDLHVVYRLGAYDVMKYMSRSKVRLVRTAEWAKAAISRTADFPAVSHPLLFVQPETGRKLLNLSPLFAMSIEELGDAEGHALLRALADHIHDSPAYHHQWTTNEMILWDNWRMLHSVSLVPLDEERVMQRTTIKGDYGVGRKLPIMIAAE